MLYYLVKNETETGTFWRLDATSKEGALGSVFMRGYKEKLLVAVSKEGRVTWLLDDMPTTACAVALYAIQRDNSQKVVLTKVAS